LDSVGHRWTPLENVGQGWKTLYRVGKRPTELECSIQSWNTFAQS
jgi:hypothetical protein